MKTIIVDIRMLKALAIAASTDGARLSLHGVFLDKEGYAVATDGAILLCGALDAVLDKSFTIPSCLLDSAQLTLDDDMTITIDYRGQKLIDKAIDSRFPDYRRVVPESVNSIHAHYVSQNCNARKTGAQW